MNVSSKVCFHINNLKRVVFTLHCSLKNGLKTHLFRLFSVTVLFLSFINFEEKRLNQFWIISACIWLRCIFVSHVSYIIGQCLIRRHGREYNLSTKVCV